MKRSIFQQLPAGLLDNNCELFANGEDVYATYAGKVHAFKEFPSELIKVINEDMYAHPEAIEAMIDCEIVTDEEMLWQYIKCRFGGFDGKPDITFLTENEQTTHSIEHTEYWECGFRGHCPMEGRLCPSVKVNNGHLTHREIQYLKHTANGLLDKEAAEEMGVSVLTIPSFKRRLQEKTGLTRKVDFTRLAINLNLIK